MLKFYANGKIKSFETEHEADMYAAEKWIQRFQLITFKELDESSLAIIVDGMETEGTIDRTNDGTWGWFDEFKESDRFDSPNKALKDFMKTYNAEEPEDEAEIKHFDITKKAAKHPFFTGLKGETKNV